MPPQTLSYAVDAESSLAPSRTVLLFFISGNPGLIGYYEPFLAGLSQLLAASPPLKRTSFRIYAQDLAGFSDDDHEPFSAQRPPRDVDFQVTHLLAVLSGLRVEHGRRKGEPYDDVLLMGHSVGAYIALQIFQRLLRDPRAAPHLRLRAGLMLFPTIEHIAQSPSGRRLDLLRRTPVLGRHAHAIARAFLRPWPYGALHWVVSRVLGFPPHGAAVTARFLKSRDGVWQALHMGMDEMQVIAEDRWDEALWAEAGAPGDAAGYVEPPPFGDADDIEPKPKFFFFFGQDDHWVAAHLRDAFIARRTARGSRFVVDEANIPHAFCFHHNELVADKVKDWIGEIYSA